MWDDLVRGAIGAVVLVDTRRLADCFAAIDFFEDRGLPYVVGVNCFDGVLSHRIEDVREAMSIDDGIPIVSCDARHRESTKQTSDRARRARHAHSRHGGEADRGLGADARSAAERPTVSRDGVIRCSGRRCTAPSSCPDPRPPHPPR